ncbi:NAD(P)-dependent dehydrogenase (short-subunit alcohol dehydrogenase family) [Bradyrhizobium sp. USDA 4011]
MERKVVVVTGASQGLGEAFVKAYRERGWRAVGNSRSIAPSGDPDYVTVAGDVGEPEIARKVVWNALERFGRVDTLINNAGIWRPGPIEGISEDLYRRVMSTNLDSMFFATQAAVPAMKKQGGGHIVQISTSLVEHALQTVPAVLASLTKGAGVAATRGLAMELASSNIRVNTIARYRHHAASRWIEPGGSEVLLAAQLQRQDRGCRAGHQLPRGCRLRDRRDPLRRWWSDCGPLILSARTACRCASPSWNLLSSTSASLATRALTAISRPHHPKEISS